MIKTALCAIYYGRQLNPGYHDYPSNDERVSVHIYANQPPPNVVMNSAIPKETHPSCAGDSIPLYDSVMYHAALGYMWRMHR